MAKSNFNLTDIITNTKNNETYTKETQILTVQGEENIEKIELEKEKLEVVKKCLLNIPVSLHKPLKTFCAKNDVKVSEFILLAIKEKLER